MGCSRILYLGEEASDFGLRRVGPLRSGLLLVWLLSSAAAQAPGPVAIERKRDAFPKGLQQAASLRRMCSCAPVCTISRALTPALGVLPCTLHTACSHNMRFFLHSADPTSNICCSVASIHTFMLFQPACQPPAFTRYSPHWTCRGG